MFPSPNSPVSHHDIPNCLTQPPLSSFTPNPRLGDISGTTAPSCERHVALDSPHPPHLDDTHVHEFLHHGSRARTRSMFPRPTNSSWPYLTNRGTDSRDSWIFGLASMRPFRRYSGWQVFVQRLTRWKPLSIHPSMKAVVTQE